MNNSTAITSLFLSSAVRSKVSVYNCKIIIINIHTVSHFISLFKTRYKNVYNMNNLKKFTSITIGTLIALSTCNGASNIVIRHDKLAENYLADLHDSPPLATFYNIGVSGNGDSGGPTFIKEGDDYFLLGASSRADSEDKYVGEYGVEELYTRASTHI